MSLINKIKGAILKKVFKSAYRPGSYYSTIPDLLEVRTNASRIFANKLTTEIGAIDIDRDAMASFLNANRSIMHEFPFPSNKSEGFRYYTDNTFFNISDGRALFTVLRSFKPGRVIEIGSGFSSALMLDVRDRYYKDQSLHLTFVEPYPDRLNSLLTAADHSQSRILITKVQEVSPSDFMELKENDLLFIDSSHVSKVGSDVNYLLFEILPKLNKGVLVHFHDIFYPFEYPRDWIEQGIAWNEMYLLRAFLMHNDHYRIVLFNSFVGKDETLKALAPDLSIGGSIYLQKVK
ncbi:MAG TPA: class I SAM-dependent methyltransferase [Cyclobacteriaceae bacterium]|nr:class I SAM-dependent methyltransferase [Cyclobacteriaceae bacterium]